MVMPSWLSRRLTDRADCYQRVATGEDEYGNVVYEDRLVLTTPALLQPVSQQEIQNGTAQVGTFILILPDIAAGFVDGFSRVEVEGQSYEAIAPPALTRSLLSRSIHHVELTLQRSSA